LFQILASTFFLNVYGAAARTCTGRGGAGRCVHGECCPLSFFLPLRGVVTNVIYYLIYRRQM